MRVNAGKLDKRITILRTIKNQDADGYWTETTEPVHACWAQFSRTSGKELAQNNADYTEILARFLIRYTSKPIDRKMIVEYAGDRYEIAYINDYGDQNDYMEIVAKRLTLEG